MAFSKLEARGHLLHKTGTPPKHFSRECMWAYFFQISTFLLTKVLREGNLFAKKVHSSVNSALTKPENVGR